MLVWNADGFWKTICNLLLPVDTVVTDSQKEDFERAQRENIDESNTLLPSATLLGYHAQLKAISARAWSNGWQAYQIALYRIGEMLKDLEETVGYDPEVYSGEKRTLARAAELTRHDLQEVEAVLATGELYQPKPEIIITVDLKAKQKFEESMQASRLEFERSKETAISPKPLS